MIDFERLTVAWLNGGDLAAHAATRHPERLDDGWLRISLISAVTDPRSPAFDHATALLQVDCYAGRGNAQGDALGLATAVAERLHAMTGVHPAGVVSSVTGLTTRRLPDTSIDPARERYIVEASVYAHR